MIRATIVLLVAHLIVPRLRRRSAAERHLLWAVSLGTAAVLPVLGVLLPAWQPAWTRDLVDAWAPSFAALGPWTAQGGPDVVVRATGIEASAWTLGDWAALIWTAGAVVTLLVLASEVVKLARLLSAVVPVVDGRCLRISGDVARDLRLSRLPLLLQSPRALIPVTWGARRPRVLLPAAATGWTDERLRAVLAHEFAHVRRGDWLVHVLAHVVCATYWFHPLFWMTERDLCRESEQAADDEVLRLGLDGGNYAAHLLAIVRASRASASSRAPLVAMARRSHLERRVAALLNACGNRGSITRRAVVATAAIAIVVAVPLVAMTNAGAAADIAIQTLNLRPVMSASDASGPEPVVPAVRLVRVAGAASDTGGSVVAPVVAEYTTPPLYSDEARRRGIEGLVTVGVQVDASGRLTRASIVKGLGFGLDQNALVALRQWRFRPGVRAGRPAAIDAEIDIEFSLRSEAVNELIANDMATLVGPGVAPPHAVRTAGFPRRVGARGTVLLDVVLQEDGTPKIVRILRSLTPEADEVAVRHFEQWRFSPAMKDGRPVKVRMNAEVRFHG